MTKIQRYDLYKDSGIEWLGEIPKHWEILKTKYINKNIKFLNTNRICDNVLSLTLRGVVNNNIDNPEGLVPKDYATYQIFEKDDLVFKLIDLENISTSRVGIVHEKGIMSSAYIRLKIGKTSIPKFAYYYYYSLYVNKVYNNIGCGVRLTLNPNDLLNIKFPIPPKSEQEKIASYLDDKIFKIDTAISGKEKLIELLKEQKQIIINDAVTKGLNKNAKFKNSGVEWLGEIPKHWEIVKFKHLFCEKRKTCDINLNCGSISFGNIVEKDDEKIPLSTKASYQVLNKGEFLINPLNLNYDLKSLRIALSDLDVVVSSGYIVIKNKVDINKKYFNWLLHIYDILFMKTLGVGVRQTLNFNDIGKTLLVVPPKPEQEKIVKYIENKTNKIDKLVNLQQEYIERLKEYKTSLIDIVVTGKVRIV